MRLFPKEELEFVKPTVDRFKNQKVAARGVTNLREAGLITRADDGIIRFMPPLIITKDEVDESIAIMDKVIGELEKELLPR